MKMTSFLRYAVSFAMVMVASGLFASSNAQSKTLTRDLGSHKAHLFPKKSQNTTQTKLAEDKGPLVYTAGGSVMTGPVKIYSIFWVPPTLQDGSAAQMLTAYQKLQNRLIIDYPGHGLANNNTQHYQVKNNVKTYISSQGSFGGSYIHTAPYPLSTCQNSITPANCMTDADLQAEIQDVMALKGWTGGLNTLFMVYIAKGEDICFDSSASSDCAMATFCGYHSYIATTKPVIYAMMPYGDPIGCGGLKTPNNSPAAEAAMDTASHEISEAITDPLLNAWMTAQGNENADLCITSYLPNSWKNGQANQMWNGHFYELQQVYNNHIQACANIGP